MKQIACLAGLLLWSGAMFAAPTGDNALTTGIWKIDGDVQGRPVNMMCTLTENDHKLSGTCSGAIDGYKAHQVTGKVKAQKAEFYFQASYGSNPITLIVSGTMNDDGSKMNGDLDVEPMAVGGAFTGTREQVPDGSAPPSPAGTATSAAAGTAADASQGPAAGMTTGTASGTWKVDANVQGNPAKLTCELAEAEHQLTGTCTDEEGMPHKLTGATTDTGLNWHFDAEYQGQAISVTMTGTLMANATKMNGTVAVAPMDADGTFVAVKQ